MSTDESYVSSGMIITGDATNELVTCAERYMLAVKRLGEESGYNRLTFFEAPILKMPTEDMRREAHDRWLELNNAGQALTAATEAAKLTPAQAASNQSSHSERISAADKDRECSIDGGRTQIVVLTREAIKRAIHPFCFSGKNADAIADSILALAPVAPAPVSLLEAIHRLEDMIPKLRIDHSHREAEILHNIIHHLSRLASFEDPKTPGMVSVGLLNTERSTGDRLRVENDQLRAALAAQPPAAPVEKRPPGAGPAGATFGGFEPLSPPQSCSAETGHDEDHTRSNSNAD